MDIDVYMETYSDYLYRIALVYVKDEGLAEEIVQDVFFTFSKKHTQFRGDASLKTYLTKMTVNRAYDYLRSWKYRGQQLIEKMQPAAHQTERIVFYRETYGEVTAAIFTLPLKYREVILLHYYEEMTTKEMAQFTKVPESTIKSRLQRARVLLKEQLHTIEWEEMDYEN